MEQFLYPILIGIGIGSIGMVMYFILSRIFKSDKIKILFFDTDKTCTMKDPDVKDGKIRIGKKTWNITKEKTYMLKEKKAVKPFMILAHDCSKAIDIARKKPPKGIRPDEMSSLLNMNVLKTLIEPSGALGGKLALGFSIIMFGFGIAMGIALVSMGVVTV